jgi:hypothetical protein
MLPISGAGAIAEGRRTSDVLHSPSKPATLRISKTLEVAKAEFEARGRSRAIAYVPPGSLEKGAFGSMPGLIKTFLVGKACGHRVA